MKSRIHSLAAAAACLFASVAQKAHDALFNHLTRTGLVLGVNAFSKEERVAFETMLEGFEDGCELSNEVEIYRTNAQEMERSSQTIWVPQPYIATSYDGLDQTSNFNGLTQLSVPLSIGYSKAVPWTMTASELNDALQNDRLGEAAQQKIASDINVACSNVACLQGSLFVKRTAAPVGYDDVAECDSIMNEQGVQTFKRGLVLHTRRYNAMAGNLANRGTMPGKVERAYMTNFVGDVAGFNTWKAGYTYRLTAALGVTVTINEATAGNRRWIPKATSAATTGETSNVDNRFMTMTFAVTSGTAKVGDAFTIAGVNAVHHITKADTGQLKTFRITGIVSGAGGSGVWQFTPPIIAADSAPTAAELQYKNVTATPANGAAIVFLNTVADNLSPFWTKDALKLLPGRYSPVENAGLAVMRATTKQGLELIMTKQGSINDLSAKYRVDCRFGVTAANTEMMGVMAFSQT